LRTAGKGSRLVRRQVNRERRHIGGGTMRRRAWWVILAAVGLPFTAQAQERAVSGTVKNAVSGVAVRGAEISEVGGRASARSDATGRFTILVPAGALRPQARGIRDPPAGGAVAASDPSVPVAVTDAGLQLAPARG